MGEPNNNMVATLRQDKKTWHASREIKLYKGAENSVQWRTLLKNYLHYEGHIDVISSQCLIVLAAISPPFIAISPKAAFVFTPHIR